MKVANVNAIRYNTGHVLNRTYNSNYSNRNQEENTTTEMSFGSLGKARELANTKIGKGIIGGLLAFITHFGAYKLGKFVEEMDSKIVPSIVGNFSTPGKFPTMENPIKFMTDSKNLYLPGNKGNTTLRMNSDHNIFSLSDKYDILNTKGQTVGHINLWRDVSSLAQDSACKKNMEYFAEEFPPLKRGDEGINVVTYDSLCNEPLKLVSDSGKLTLLWRQEVTTPSGTKAHLQSYSFKVDE